jgi:hypothetical protein
VKKIWSSLGLAQPDLDPLARSVPGGSSPGAGARRRLRGTGSAGSSVRSASSSISRRTTAGEP